MKLVHLVQIEPWFSPGVLNKVRAKSAALHRLGGVRTCYTGRGGPTLELQAHEEWRSLRRGQAEAMEELLSAHPDALFLLRYPLASHALWRVLRRHPGRVVFEHNTLERRELLFRLRELSWPVLLEILGHRPRRLWGEYLGPLLREMVYGGACVKLSRAAVCVCESVRDSVWRRCPEKPALVLGNGIEPDKVALRASHPLLSREIRLLFLCGSPWSWTGADRLLRSLLAYRGGLAIELHCAGQFAPAVRRLAARVEWPHRVIFHGELSRQDVVELAAHCHLGVGTLGLHRLGLRDGSTLKVRECMAMGLPFLLGYRDVDLPEGYPYALTFPADESLLCFERVKDFLSALLAGGFAPQTMREESLPLIAMEPKMRRLLEFLSTL